MTKRLRCCALAALFFMFAGSACSIVANSAESANKKLVRKVSGLAFSVEEAREIYSEEAAASGGQFYTWELTLALDNPNGAKIKYSELQDANLLNVLDKDGILVPAKLVPPEGAEAKTLIPQGASLMRLHVNLAEQQNISAVCIAENQFVFSIAEMPSHFTPVPAE